MRRGEVVLARVAGFACRRSRLTHIDLDMVGENMEGQAGMGHLGEYLSLLTSELTKKQLGRTPYWGQDFGYQKIESQMVLSAAFAGLPSVEVEDLEANQNSSR
jgi:hypothetical protein